LLQNKERQNEKPTHKTAHLQTAQADTQPKFAKELFSSNAHCSINSIISDNN